MSKTFCVPEPLFQISRSPIGELEGQSAKLGSLRKKLDIKGEQVKPLRGLEMAVVQQVLTQVKLKEISTSKMTKEAKKIKELKEIQ